MTPRFEPLQINDLALTLIERSPYAILVCDESGVICHINPTITDLLGYSPGTLVGEHINCLIPEQFHNHQDNVNAYFQQPQQDPMQDRGILFARHQQGHDVAVDISLIHYSTGDKNYAVTIIRDNSELLTSRDACYRSEIRFHGIFEQAPVAMALNDNQGNITALNSMFTETFGYDRLDIPTLTDWFNRAYPDPDYQRSVQTRWNLAFDTAKATGSAVAPMEVKVTCKDGSVRVCQVSARPLEESLLREHLVILIDITERHQKAVNDQENANRFRDMISNHQLPMLIIEPDKGRIIFTNNSACEFYGYSYSQLTSMRVHDFYRDDPASIDRTLSSVAQGSVKSFSKTQYSHDGKAHWVDIYSSVTDIGGNRFIYSIVVDKTDKQRVEKQLVERERQYRNLYHNSATPICTEDFSRLYEQLERIRSSGVNDLRSYLDNNPQQLVNLSHQITITEVNPALQQLFALNDKNIPRITLEDNFGDGVLDVFKEAIIAIWDGKSNFESNANFIDSQGNKITGIVSLPLPDCLENSKNIPVSIWDITKLESAQQELLFHSQVLSSLQEGVHLVNAGTGTIVYCNQRLADIFGYNCDDIIGKHVSFLYSGSDIDANNISDRIISELNKRGFWQGEIKNKKSNGDVFWCEAIVSSLQHPNFGKVWVSVHSDITDKHDYHQKLWRQANYDSLTQLPNRSYFYEQAEQAIANAKRHKVEFALLFIDIDNFKVINDTLGHNQGDSTLIEVSSRIQQCIRQSDLIGRFGGDEFIVLMHDVNTQKPSTIELLIQKILNAICAPFFILGESEYITASIGVSTYPENGNNIHELIQYSDQAMYKAKEHGKNQYYFFTQELQELAQRNRVLDLELRKALDENQLEIFLQPIVDSFTGEVHKAEALIRWQHPSLGLISPAEFIPIAEESKLICEVGNLVFDQCVEVLKNIKSITDDKFQISLNKSPVQLHSDKFATEFDWPKAMQDEGLDPESISIEITEGILLDEDDSTHRKIKKLKSSGFHFSIDDFGTGYSALSYLQKVDFNYLKIDKSFIDSIDTYSSNQALCQAIIAMAHSLGMRVIAEGIENEKQYKQLKDMQCDYCQGYYFAKPMPRNDFIAYLKKKSKWPVLVGAADEVIVAGSNLALFAQILTGSCFTRRSRLMI